MFINLWRLFLIRALFPSVFLDFFAVSFFSHYYYYLVSGTRLTIAFNAHCSWLLLLLQQLMLSLLLLLLILQLYEWPLVKSL